MLILLQTKNNKNVILTKKESYMGSREGAHIIFIAYFKSFLKSPSLISLIGAKGSSSIESMNC